MRLSLLTLALIALTGNGLIDSTTNASDHGHQVKVGTHSKANRHALCPHCGETCYPTVTKGKDTKHCWEVDSKTICIPKVRFPWEKDHGKKSSKEGCPAPKCGRTKVVKVLRKVEYECSTCKYSWDVDSYKSSKDKHLRSDAGIETNNPSPTVTAPPPVEASLPRTKRRIVRVSF